MYLSDVCDLHACWVELIFFEVILKSEYALGARLGLILVYRLLLSLISLRI